MPAAPQPRYDRSNDLWYLRIAGRKIYRSTRAEIYDLYAEQLAGAKPGNEPTMLALAITRWRDLHPKDHDRWRTHRFLEWAGKLKLSDLGPDTLADYQRHLEGRGYSASTIRAYVTYAAVVLRWMAKQGWRFRMPDAPRLPRCRNAPRDLPPGTLDALLGYLDKSKRRSRAARLLRFCLFTGCRPGEARLLKWSDVHLDQGDFGMVTLAAHKTAKSTGQARFFVLNREARAILDEAPSREAGGLVFPSANGTAYTRHGLRSILRRAELGKVTPYNLRHTAAQHWLDAGVPIDALARQLGHSDLRMVQVYAQTRAKRVNQEVASRPAPGGRSPRPARAARQDRRASSAGDGAPASPEQTPDRQGNGSGP